MSIFTIKNSLDDELSTLEKWEEGFKKVDDPKHWESGYSAHSLATFIMSKKGDVWLDTVIKDILKEDIEWHDARIEHESKLDRYTGKHRVQDMALWGETTSGKKVFVGIEAKVLEPFGNHSLRDEYEDALDYQKNKKANSKRPDRVEAVTDFLFPGKSPYDAHISNLRYQLMYYFKGSILEASTYSKSKGSLKDRNDFVDIVILPVLVFKTEHYKSDMEKAQTNEQDFIDFCDSLNLSLEETEKLTLRTGEIKGRKVITFYEKVDI